VEAFMPLELEDLVKRYDGLRARSGDLRRHL
jgi:hypothetical protein